MTRQDTALSLVPADGTAWSVEHALPGRLRIRCTGLARSAQRQQAFRQTLLSHPAVNAVQVNSRTGSAVINYSRRRLQRREVDELLYRGLSEAPYGDMPHLPDISRDTHLGLLLATMALTPFLPHPLRYAATLTAIAPTLLRAGLKLREGGGASRMLDSSALLLSTLSGRYGVAQINNFMHTLGGKLEQQAVCETEFELRGHAAPSLPLYTVARNGDQHEIEASALLTGDRFSLLPGQLVPIESLVLAGSGRVQRAFTGEELDVAAGHHLVAGSSILEGDLQVASLRDWAQGNFARLAAFIEIAIHNRENHDQYAANLSDRLVPFTMILSGAVYGFTRDLGRASSAMQAEFGVANEQVTPVCVESTIAAGASQGILMRGGHAIERLARLDTLVFDRSGTLTRGDWHLSHLEPAAKTDETWCRDIMAQLVSSCCRDGITGDDGAPPPLVFLSHSEMQEVEEHGLHLARDGDVFALVSLATARDRFGLTQPVEPETCAPGSSCCLLVNGKLKCLIRFCDSPAPGSLETMDILRAQGIKRLYLVSHKSASSLHPELASLPLDGFQTGLNNLEKLQFIQGLIDRGRRVGLVSDGMFLSGSDCLNLCLGTSRDARPLDADIWLMSEDLRSLAAAHRLAVDSTARLRRSHRGTQAGRGAALLATSFDLLPPGIAATIGNAVTLGIMRNSRKITRRG